MLENNQPRFLSPADIESDFAWRIKYVPAGEMIEPAYRQIAKRILVNETRRIIEKIHDLEIEKTFSLNPNFLGKEASTGGHSNPNHLAEVERKWLQLKKTSPVRRGLEGYLAETMAREIIARWTGSKSELFFRVKRANALEEGEFKIDFKIVFVQHRRGVSVGDGQKIQKVIDRIGFQFTIKRRRNKIMSKETKIFAVKEKWQGKLPVDDIVVVQIKPGEFGQAFDQWLKESKPSGGPEQFLSEELKQELWQKITAGLLTKEKTEI